MKYIVLLSGGVDSATCLATTVRKYDSERVLALSVFYGQRHKRELQSAVDIAEYYGVPRHELDLSMIFAKSPCPLLNAQADIPQGSYDEQQKENNGVVKTYVPFRNGLMLSAAASYGMALYPDETITLVIGAHADDAAGNAYPDCSEIFIEKLSLALNIGSGGKVFLSAPYVRWNKAQVVRDGLHMGVPYHLTWSCYEGQDKPCGKCGTCIDREKAFEANGVKDPAR